MTRPRVPAKGGITRDVAGETGAERHWEELFSTKVAVGSRTYFIDVQQAANGVRCQKLSESRRRKGDEKAVAAIEAQVDLESTKLWTLSPFDLAEIQRSLKELTE